MGERMRRSVVLASRPLGEPVPENFRLVEERLPPLAEGEVLLRTLWLSVDPYQRGQMDEVQGYAAPTPIGSCLPADLVSEVVESRDARWAVGTVVTHAGGWRDHSVSDGKELRRLDPEVAPVTTALGVLRMTGMTAWVGLEAIGQPRPGETLVVGAAAGAVGSVVGQIARLRGCRVVGIAGGERKCRYLLEELRFDAAVDHREPDLAGRLAAACPEGIDIYWENVGGEVLWAALPLLNPFGRVPLCGYVAHYNDRDLPSGPDRSLLLWDALLSKRLRVQGFIVDDHADRSEAFRREMETWLREGSIVYREDIVDGLDRAPERLAAMLRGETFGKALIQVDA